MSGETTEESKALANRPFRFGDVGGVRPYEKWTEKRQPLECCSAWDFCGAPGIARWSRRQESNLYLPLRRRPFYPLNYGERLAAWPGEGWQFKTSPCRGAASYFVHRFADALGARHDHDRRNARSALERKAGGLSDRVRRDRQLDSLSRRLRRRRRAARGPVRFRSVAPRRRGRRSCLHAEPHRQVRLGRRAVACGSSSSRRRPLFPAQGPVQIDGVVAARLCLHREPLGDAVDELPAAGRRVEAALVADIPALRDLLAEADDGLLDLTRSLAHRDLIEADRVDQAISHARPFARQERERGALQQGRVVAAGAVAGTAEHEPAQLVDVAHVGLREQADARVERRARGLHADANVEVGPSGLDVEPRVVDRPDEAEDAAIDRELLRIGLIGAIDGIE